MTARSMAAEGLVYKQGGDNSSERLANSAEPCLEYFDRCEYGKPISACALRSVFLELETNSSC